MIVARTRELVFRLAPYETLRTAVTIQADTSEIELPDGVGLEDHLDSVMDDMLALDVARADAMTTTPADETFVHAWKGETTQ